LRQNSSWFWNSAVETGWADADADAEGGRSRAAGMTDVSNPGGGGGGMLLAVLVLALMSDTTCAWNRGTEPAARAGTRRVTAAASLGPRETTRARWGSMVAVWVLLVVLGECWSGSNVVVRVGRECCWL
jgi:hypothetical protein